MIDYKVNELISVKQFIEYPDFRKKVKENLKSIESDTRQEVRKIYELLEG